MNASLSHLPEDKKNQILELKELILKKVTSTDKIILFGSYASGNWVEDKYTENGIRYEYVSDYDVLIVTTSKEEKEYVSQDKIVNSWRYHTPVNPIVHTIDYVNEGLRAGQYFFTDIIKEGVLLHDAQITHFENTQEIDLETIRRRAEANFHQWYENGKEFLIDANNAKERKSFSKVSFYLHQATENFYSTVLLVYSGYKPKSHNLKTLREYVKPYSKELYSVFSPLPENSKEVELFSLLKRGYVEARYNLNFNPSEDDINHLFEKVYSMAEIVKKACTEKLLTLQK